MNTQEINHQKMSQQMNDVKKSSNVFIGTTVFVMLAIIVIGFVFG